MRVASQSTRCWISSRIAGSQPALGAADLAAGPVLIVSSMLLAPGVLGAADPIVRQSRRRCNGSRPARDSVSAGTKGAAGERTAWASCPLTATPDRANVTGESNRKLSYLIRTEVG